ncbi:hypothetical protein ACE1ET_15940 [Saccharicrinis sp. FJH62]|uniref:hypothetical protein n=1 Tax=Saccharicrinis sp. FJH62 TaxID=3344657 RepID=UPI0035D449F3
MQINFESLQNVGTVKFEITAEDLRRVIEDTVKMTSASIMESFKAEQQPTIISRKEAMEILEVKSKVTMVNWEKKGYLNPKRIGSRVFYDKDEVLNAAESFTRMDY